MSKLGRIVLHSRWCRGVGGHVTHSDVRRLSEQAFRLRFSDHCRMQELAEFAVTLGRALPNTKRASDSRARAHGVLGNSLRIVGDHAGAERHLDEALLHWHHGTRQPHLGARVAELRGSLFEACRQFDLALAELDSAEEHRRAARLDLGKVHAQRGNVYAYQGDALGAISAFERAIRETRDKTIRRAAILSAAFALTEAERWRAAHELLLTAREYLQTAPAGLAKRLPWIEARIARSQGAFRGAEQLFRRARHSLLRARMTQEAALVSVDLALLLADQGRILEAWSIAREAGTLLAALNGESEALAASILCRVSAERLSVDLVKSGRVLFPMRATLQMGA